MFTDPNFTWPNWNAGVKPITVMGFKPYHFCHCLKIFGKRFAPITYPTLGKRKIILESVLKWDISVRKRVASPFEIFFFSSFFYMRNSRFVLFFFDFNLSTKILTQKQTSTQKFHRIKGPILDATHPPTAAPSSWIPSHPIHPTTPRWPTCLLLSSAASVHVPWYGWIPWTSCWRTKP